MIPLRRSHSYIPSNFRVSRPKHEIEDQPINLEK